MFSYLASCPAHHAALLCGVAAPLVTFGGVILFIGAVEVAAEILEMLFSLEKHHG